MRLHGLIIAFALAGCSPQSDTNPTDTQSTSNTPQEVNVYSYRKEALIKPALDQFTAKTGIKVNLLTGKADALFQRLVSEGENTPADILITTDAGRLHRATEANLLQSIESDTLTSRIPESLRDPQNRWFGLSSRARVIFYNKEKVDVSELSTYEDLANSKWKGRICIRSSSNIYNQSLLASLIANEGEENAQTWANGVVANMARLPEGNDRAQMAGAATGVCDIAIANTYYYGAWLNSDKPEDQENATKIAVFYPNQDGRGAHINVSGAGVIKYAKNKDNAIALIEYLASKEAQDFYANVNNEYPVTADAEVSELVKSWGYPFKSDALNLSKLGELNASAVKIFDKAGWK